ncbi:uncharacterized protein [Venturia canescens]|uniref:uncharacterized protein isoform X3 n=1 Tax=Venturia canescens TaxID=32260 RepID=UPI001C9D2B05|nr:uncharacterized protein LOC122417850 isoform X3 [Venturia canescens]
MGVTGGVKVVEKTGISLERCLCIVWIFVSIAWRESQQSSVIIVRDESCDPCYRKLLSGKRILDSHVRRNVPCERIEECHRVCEYESAFVCEGFNYGLMRPFGTASRRMEAGPNYGRSPDGDTRRGYMCQLTSVSDGRMDPRRDFVDDPRYDYYARDWSCPAGKVHRERAYGGGPSSHLPGRRPSDQSDWRPMSFPPSAAPGRPFDPPAYGDSTRSYYPPGRYVPTRNRPGDYDRYASDDRQRPWGSYLPRGTPFHNEIGQHRYYYGDRDYYPNRRVDDQRFWPRQPAPGPNDIVEPNHPPYGRSYGYGTHYYPYQRSKDHPVPDPYEYWPKTRGPPRKPTILEPPERHYGSNYGPAYGYHSSEALPDDSYRPTWKPRHRQPWLGTDRKDCSVRSLMGFKITRKIVVASHATANLEECEMLCSARTDCFSFAYRYSLVATAPTDNCLLSNLPFDRLNFYTDLEPERDYDVYAIVGDPKRCQESKKPDDAQVGPHRRSSEECFWRVQSGCGMPPSLTRKKIRAENGLGECQIACITARHFTCRSFVFRYDSEGDRDPNCFLSDCPTTEIIAAIEADTSLIVPGRDLELYERGSYGRGCEASPFTPIYNSANIGDKKRPPDPGPGDCWSAYRAGCKLAPSAVSSMSRVDSEVECRRQCSRMRYNQHSPTCMSFSFRLGDEKRGDNCYLSDVPRRDLRPGLDYSYDDDYVTYAWKELEPQCSAPPGPGYDYAPPSGVKFNYDSGAADYRPGDPPNAPPPAPGHAGPGLYTYNTLFLGVRPLDSGRPDAATPPEHPTSTYLPNDETSGDGFPGPDYTDGIGSFNRHYTVNGYPCKRGTKCEVNKIAGFWSCEPEGSEFGSWDYCCEPNHHCGFSQGYNYPWCYVGASEEQWRPCSEKYYPYLPSPRPAINRSPTSDYYFNTGNDRNGNRGFYRSEGSGRSEVNSRNCCGARHWPIAFLHPVPPPNTTDSVALANDRRDSSERDVNKTGESSGSTTPGRLDRDKNASSTTEETVNSSIIRIQPYKSHLKRRGLVSPSSTTNRTKAWHKKFHRISIRPANSNGNISLDTTIANHENEFRVNKIHDLDSFDVNNINLTSVRDKSRFARIERVTRANKVELETRPKESSREKI